MDFGTQSGFGRDADRGGGGWRVGLGTCGQAPLRKHVDGLVDRNPDNALGLIDPAVAVEELVFGGAHLLQVLNRSLLQLRLGREPPGVDVEIGQAASNAGFEILE